MTRAEDDRYRVSQVSGSKIAKPFLTDKFRSAFQQGPISGQSFSKKEDEALNYRRHQLSHPALDDSAEHSPEKYNLSQQMLRSFSETVQYSSVDQNGPNSTLIGLLHDISNGISAGRRISARKWRLILRLREDFLNQTNLEISCMNDEFSVIFRTANDEVYQMLVQSLPMFNATLRKRDWGSKDATVFFINIEELQ